MVGKSPKIVLDAVADCNCVQVFYIKNCAAIALCGAVGCIRGLVRHPGIGFRT